MALSTLRDIIHAHRLTEGSDTPHVDKIRSIIASFPPGVAESFSLKLTHCMTETFRDLRTLRRSTKTNS